eukprot:Nitzschia sp. Nitz4//scaffold3_size479765//140789//141113//NITZ4_000061-RA/size479765-augustus-gene-0.32-mRNA-1//-1//CDS//3329550641//8882//frame0
MSSGIGVKGTIGRCYPFYADLRNCVAKKTISSPQVMCWQENEDYFECVHGFKEKERIMKVQSERKRREELGEKFAIKS